MDRKIKKEWNGRSLKVSIEVEGAALEFVAIAKDHDGRRWSTMAFITTEDGEQNLDQWENDDVSAIEAGLLADKFEKEVCK